MMCFLLLLLLLLPLCCIHYIVSYLENGTQQSILCSYDWSRSNFFKIQCQTSNFFSIYIIILYNASVFPMLNTINARCITYCMCVFLFCMFLLFCFQYDVWHSPWIAQKVKLKQKCDTRDQCTSQWLLYCLLIVYLFIRAHMNGVCMLSMRVCVCVQLSKYVNAIWIWHKICTAAVFFHQRCWKAIGRIAVSAYSLFLLIFHFVYTIFSNGCAHSGSLSYNDLIIERAQRQPQQQKIDSSHKYDIKLYKFMKMQRCL